MEDKTEKSPEKTDNLVPDDSPSNQDQTANKADDNLPQSQVNPSHTSQATAQSPPSGGFNPCKCCHRGNLRKTCCVIAALEIFLGMDIKTLSNQLMIAWMTLTCVLSIGMPTALCLAIHKVSKVGCLVHSVLAALSGLLMLTVVIAIPVLVYGYDTGFNVLKVGCGPDSIAVGDNRKQYNHYGGQGNQDVTYDYVSGNEEGKKKRRTAAPYSYKEPPNRCVGPGGETYAIIVCVFCGIFFLLFLYSMVASIGLYTKFRAGNRYEGTDLSCCGCCGRRRFPVVRPYSTVGYPVQGAGYTSYGYPAQGGPMYTYSYPYPYSPSANWGSPPPITPSQQAVQPPQTTTSEKKVETAQPTS